MHYKFAALALSLATVAAPAHAQSGSVPSVDMIVQRHITARGGGDAIKAIRSLAYRRGTYSEPGYQGRGNAAMFLMRPYYKVVGDPTTANESLEGYDGEAWEWYSNPGIVVRTVGPASEALRHFADVEGPFFDYKSKGHKLEYVGTEKLDGRAVYNLRLTMMDGYTTDNLFDAQNYMHVGSRHSAAVHAFGDKVTSISRFGDFRRVAGVLFPFRGEEVEIGTGKVLNSMQWGSIEANTDIPLAWFSPPEFKRGHIQNFIEQMYRQRSDPKSVMWTYHAFRRAYPGLDTSDAAQVAGFQSLKMGAVDTAIVLLEQNVRDYPNGANAAFGLGRAYERAKRYADARRELERAIKLDPKHERAKRMLEGLPAAGG